MLLRIEKEAGQDEEITVLTLMENIKGKGRKEWENVRVDPCVNQKALPYLNI